MNPAAFAAKQKNARRILNYIIINGETSRAELARELHISTGTVTNIVTELMEGHFLYESRQEPSSVGKKTSLLAFQADRGCVITLELSHDVASIYCCDLLGTPLSERHIDYQLTITETRTEIDILKDIIGMLKGFVASLDEPIRKKLKAVGISIIGMVNTQRMIDAPSINWKNINLIIPIQAALGLPVFCEGITRIKAFYEMRYIRPEEKNIIFLNLYDGVGMVNFFNGKMVLGRTGIAGEVGHMSLNLHGPKCYCGNRGCFEYYCGMRNILEKARELLVPENESDVFYDMVVRQKKELTPELLFESREKGSLIIHTLLCSVAEYLGFGLAALYNIYDPDRIILTGYLSNAEDFVTERAKAEARSRIVNHFSREVLLTPARLSHKDLYRAITAYVTSNLLDRVYK